MMADADAAGRGEFTADDFPDGQGLIAADVTLGASVQRQPLPGRRRCGRPGVRTRAQQLTEPVGDSVDPQSGQLTPRNADGSAWISFTNVKKKVTTGPAGPHMMFFDPGIKLAPGEH
jgi:hypothetical protein